MSVNLKNVKKLEDSFKSIENWYNGFYKPETQIKAVRFPQMCFELYKIALNTICINNSSLISEPIFYKVWGSENIELKLKFNKNTCNRNLIYDLTETVNKISNYYCYNKTYHTKTLKEDSLMIFEVVLGFKTNYWNNLTMSSGLCASNKIIKMFETKQKHKRNLKLKELKIKDIEQKRELKRNKPKKPAKIRFIPKTRPIKLGFDVIRDYNPCIPKEKEYNPEIDGYGVYDPRFEEIDTVETYDGKFDWDKYYESVI